ncbi:mechanosensitive ion channel family protein [Pseudoruegeria sp. SK021]|uniref:mechanosensitive ion channel family protein n=1 Tax=Pseudoruegeria sp. SK021 TaxID=1933035 RepID=UPI000A31F9D8|nr:mechanosensitive ion channel domain-containing protein [Pseudoruegeria sp. SK021]
MIVGLLAVSFGLNAIIGPALYQRMRALEGLPKWLLRLLLVLYRQLPLILFVGLSWATVVVIREVTWPARSYLVGIAASIATAWLLVRLAGQLVRNRLLRRLVTTSLLIYVTLYYLSLDDDAARVLSDIALDFGDLNLNALAVLKVLIFTSLLLAGARLLAQTIRQQIHANDDITPTMQVLLIKLLQVVLYVTAFFIGLKIVGVDLTGLAFLSGAIGLGVGFGLQKIVSNLVSGVIILLDKSIKPGDVISLGETFGWINALGARYVSITTRDGKEFLIPNEDLITGQVVNWSHSDEFVRLDIFFGTAYGDDPHLVREVAVAAAGSVPRVLNSRKPVCHIVGFGDSSVDYILRFWITDPSGGLTNVRGAVFLALWDAFRDNSITIPFPQREVTLMSGSPVQTKPASE